MAGRRILYGLILAAALLYQIYFHSYYAPLLLILTLALPVLSLLLSLPAMAGFRLSVSARPLSLSRGAEGVWEISPKLRVGLPLARLTAVLEEENLLTGSKTRKKLSLKGVTTKTRFSHPTSADHCGLLELQVKRLQVYDYLGLFSFPVRAPEPTRLPVLPNPVDPGHPELPEGWGIRPAPGSTLRRTIGEDYDLREYRPGDPLRSVHWKLSSKWDDLIVREPAETIVPLVLLTFDRYGAPERLDRLLDRVTGYSHTLLAIQRPHAIQWRDRDGIPVRCHISDEKELREALLTVLAAPAPLQAPPSDECPPPDADGPAILIHITPGEEDDHA